jgi:hypothetical protein
MNTFRRDRYRGFVAPVTLSAHRLTILRERTQEAQMQKFKLFANYCIPVAWGVVALVVGCVAVNYLLSLMWERIIVKPENVTPTDGLTVIILSLIGGVFIGAAALFGSAQHHWTARH